MCLLISPHFLQVVQGADIGAEEVDHDVVCVNEDPVAGGHALQGYVLAAAAAQKILKLVGKGAYKAGRGSRGDYHLIGHAGPVAHINGHNVFGFVLIEKIYKVI